MNLPQTMKICIHKEIFSYRKENLEQCTKLTLEFYQDLVSSKECEASQVLRL